MRRRRLFAIVIVMGIMAPALALSDPFSPCEAPALAPPAPVGVGAVLDLVIGPLVTKGVSILLLGSLAVVGVPWILAGLAVALVQLPERFRPRR